MSVSETLDAMAAFIGRYVDIPEQYTDAMALWCLYTHCFPYQEFSTVPYVLVTSAEKGSGKSTLLDTAARLVRSPLSSSSMSAAMVGRTIAGHTLMLDELDMVYSRHAGDNGKELAAVLNGGFHIRGTFDRLVLDKRGNYQPKSFKTFGPKMLVGIASEYPEALVSRCIHILIERADEGVYLERARDRIMEREAKPILEMADADAKSLGVLPFLDELPEANGRTLDVWEPLLSLASMDGEWNFRALDAFDAFTAAPAPEPPVQQRLLRDCKSVFDSANVESIRTRVLINSLCDLGEGWDTYNFGRPISGQALARQLAKYSVYPQREAGTNLSVYHRHTFLSAWQRYVK